VKAFCTSTTNETGKIIGDIKRAPFHCDSSRDHLTPVGDTLFPSWLTIEFMFFSHCHIVIQQSRLLVLSSQGILSSKSSDSHV
jgi:hypothetical protein